MSLGVGRGRDARLPCADPLSPGRTACGRQEAPLSAPQCALGRIWMSASWERACLSNLTRLPFPLKAQVRVHHPRSSQIIPVT